MSVVAVVYNSVSERVICLCASSYWQQKWTDDAMCSGTGSNSPLFSFSWYTTVVLFSKAVLCFERHVCCGISTVSFPVNALLLSCAVCVLVYAFRIAIQNRFYAQLSVRLIDILRYANFFALRFSYCIDKLVIPATVME